MRKKNLRNISTFIQSHAPRNSDYMTFSANSIKESRKFSSHNKTVEIGGLKRAVFGGRNGRSYIANLSSKSNTTFVGQDAVSRIFEHQS